MSLTGAMPLSAGSGMAGGSGSVCQTSSACAATTQRLATSPRSSFLILPSLPGLRRSVGREAVEQAVAAGALQRLLAAAAARGMRRVPGFGGRIVAQAHAVVMADHRGPVAAAGPVAAGPVLAGRERGAVRLRAGQDVVPVGAVAAAVDLLAVLVERGALVEVVGAVQLVDIGGDHCALGVLPRPLADPVARVLRGRAVRVLGAEIGAPGLAAGPDRLRQLLAVGVGTLQP